MVPRLSVGFVYFDLQISEMKKTRSVTTLRKWGDRLVVDLPEAFAKQLELAEGDALVLELDQMSLQLRPVVKPNIELPEAVKPITLKAPRLAKIGSWQGETRG